MSELLELAARVEAHNPADVDAGYDLGREVIEAAGDGGMAFWTLASPLYSLDAAWSLVPEQSGGEALRWAVFSNGGGKGPLAMIMRGDDWNVFQKANAATPELALTAAALRARAGGGE